MIMEMRWKIYYACSIYAFLWSTIFFVIVLHEWDSDNKIFSFALACLLLGMSLKSALSLKSAIHYRRGTAPLPLERTFILVGFCANIVFVIIMIALLIPLLYDFISNPSNYYKQDERLPYLQVFVIFSFIVVAVCAILINVYDVVILRAIRKRCHDSIQTIGQHIQP
jgi:hypothetical protein